jgi:hypothetical protein
VVTTNTLYIAITCDVVCDYFDRSIWGGPGVAPMQWRGVEFGMDMMVDALSSFKDRRSQSPRITWFITVDNHMEEHYGTPTYLLERYADQWDKCRNRGDELAWHVYQHQTGRQWHPEENPDKWRAGLATCKERMEEMGFSPRSTRIGGTYCTNDIMQILEELDIACDMTALPGRKRDEGGLKLDWEPTPDRAYHPMKADYRIPGDPAHSLLEIPLTVIPVKAAYDEKPFRRYADLSFHHQALSPGLQKFLEQNRDYLQTIIHPSAVLGDIVSKRHGLISFAIEDFTRNIHTIIEYCNISDRSFEFVTASELADVFLL